jgi:hypothetical protein
LPRTLENEYNLNFRMGYGVVEKDGVEGEVGAEDELVRTVGFPISDFSEGGVISVKAGEAGEGWTLNLVAPRAGRRSRSP